MGKDARALVALSLSLQDVVAIGLKTGQGVLVNEAFYWDLEDATRTWSTRFAARNDGRMVHDTYLFRIKTPAQSKGTYDVYEKVATIPAAEAFRPLADGKCTALWKP